MPIDPSIPLGVQPINVGAQMAAAQQQRSAAVTAQQQQQLNAIRLAEAKKAAGVGVDPDQQLLQEILQETHGDIALIPGALAKRGHFKEAMEVLKGWDEHVKATTPPPQTPKLAQIQTLDEQGKPVTQFVEEKAGASYPIVPKAENPANAPNVGSFEDYVIRRFGQTPTAQQVTQARKDYMQADDKATGFAAGDVTQLSAAGLDMAALNYKKTGVMPALGMGDKTTRQRIINRAAELTQPDMDRIAAGIGDIAANKADYRADADTLTTLTKQRRAIGAFEETAQKNIDLFLDTAGKVVDTGSPMANTVARMVSGRMLGSPNQAAYDAARQVAINEIAKITSNPTLSGTLSDSARHEVENFNPSSATLKQTVAVMRLLKKDMQNRTTSLDDAIAATRKHLGGTSTAAPAAAPASPMGLSYQDYLNSRKK